MSGISSRHGSHQLAKKFTTNGLPRKLVNPTDLPSSDFSSNGIAGLPTEGAELWPLWWSCCDHAVAGVTSRKTAQQNAAIHCEVLRPRTNIDSIVCVFIGPPPRF